MMTEEQIRIEGERMDRYEASKVTIVGGGGVSKGVVKAILQESEKVIPLSRIHHKDFTVPVKLNDDGYFEQLTLTKAQINFLEEDKKDKGLRKDITYLTKLFKDKLPKWLVDNVLKVRRGSRGSKLLSGKEGVW